MFRRIGYIKIDIFFGKSGSPMTNEQESFVCSCRYSFYLCELLGNRLRSGKNRIPRIFQVYICQEHAQLTNIIIPWIVGLMLLLPT